MPLTLVKSHLQRNLEPVLQQVIQPSSLSRLVTRLPQRLNRLIVEQMANRAFAEQIQDGDFDFLEGRQLQVEIIDAGLFAGLGFDNGRIHCTHLSPASQTADATLSIETLHALQLIEQEVDPDTLFFQRRLKIQGDTELAHHVKNTIDTLDPSVIPEFIVRLLRHYRFTALV